MRSPVRLTMKPTFGCVCGRARFTRAMLSRKLHEESECDILCRTLNTSVVRTSCSASS
jgi:hypothetical protein